MLTLNTALHNIHSSRTSATNRLGTPINSHQPRMCQRERRQRLLLWGVSQKATYYFDASWHTGKTLRHLTRVAAASDQSLADTGAISAKEFLVTHTDNFLWSLRPGAEDEMQSKSLFMILLELHLSSLEEKELEQFRCQLQAAQYTCHVTESDITDLMYLEYGFSNGAPQTTTRTLLTQPNLTLILENL